jgi:hypothetical protein
LLVLLRSAFLGTMENPEPRYTLECFPVVLVLGAGWLSRIRALSKFSGLGCELWHQLRCFVSNPFAKRRRKDGAPTIEINRRKALT